MTTDVPVTRSTQHATRRLAFLLIWLLAFDQFVPAILPPLENQRYEQTPALRFENSDLFGLGPLVAYLREHPQRTRRRAVFMGNSMIFGYFLMPEQALPAQFERQQSDAHAFNMGMNGQEMGTSYLIAKTIIDSVDIFFVQVVGEKANPILPSLVPVDDADIQSFGLERPDKVEQRLRQGLGRVWRLYAANERIQAAIFGTSTREYLYLHKRDILMKLLRRSAIPAPTPPDVAERPFLIVRPPSRTAPSNQRRTGTDTLLSRFAELGRSHRKRIVFLEFDYSTATSPAALPPFTGPDIPNAEVVLVHVPPTLTLDGQHLSAQGCRLVAALLAEYDREHAAGASGR
jgi:hypothetical protein